MVLRCSSLPVVPVRLESGAVVITPSGVLTTLAGKLSRGGAARRLGVDDPSGRTARDRPHRREITLDVPLRDQVAGQPPRLGTCFTFSRCADLASRARVAAKKRPRGRPVRRRSSRACHCSALVCRRSRISAISRERPPSPRGRDAPCSRPGAGSCPARTLRSFPPGSNRSAAGPRRDRARASPPARTPASTPPHCSSRAAVRSSVRSCAAT